MQQPEGLRSLVVGKISIENHKENFDFWELEKVSETICHTFAEKWTVTPIQEDSTKISFPEWSRGLSVLGTFLGKAQTTLEKKFEIVEYWKNQRRKIQR